MISIPKTVDMVGFLGESGPEGYSAMRSLVKDQGAKVKPLLG